MLGLLRLLTCMQCRSSTRSIFNSLSSDKAAIVCQFNDRFALLVVRIYIYIYIYTSVGRLNSAVIKHSFRRCTAVYRAQSPNQPSAKEAMDNQTLTRHLPVPTHNGWTDAWSDPTRPTGLRVMQPS